LSLNLTREIDEVSEVKSMLRFSADVAKFLRSTSGRKIAAAREGIAADLTAADGRWLMISSHRSLTHVLCVVVVFTLRSARSILKQF